MSKTTELLTAMLNDEPIENFTPRSRMEAYLKNCCLACGCDGLPEPITETDKLLFALAEKVAGAGGGEIVPLTVTENGTYTPPEGVDGYSPVEVMVTPEAGDIDTLINRTIKKITSGVDAVGAYAFRQCSALKEINFPNARTIGTSAFAYTYITSANLPECTSLSEESFLSTRLQSFSAPKLTKIAEKAFSSCFILQSFDFSNIEEVASQAFNQAYALKEAIMPKVTYFGSSAFSNCYSLSVIDVSQNVSFPYSAFGSCRSLTKIILRSETLCPLNYYNSFSGCYHFEGKADATYNPEGLKDGYIYVPSALVDSYKTATNWTTFADQFRALEDYTVDGTITGDLDPAKTGVTV